MEQIQNEQTLENTQAVETEIKEVGESKQEVSLGKFKDVQALLSAYNSLQAEFTKRCQRIKELESEGKEIDKAIAPMENPKTEEPTINQGITEEDRNAILKDYLKGVVMAKEKAIIIDGVGSGIKTPTSRPRTIAEAGALATELLKQNK